MNESGRERRAAVQVLALAALAPFAALGWPLCAQAAPRALAPLPAGPFRLERTLLRELDGGTAIVVTRRWRIGFARGAGGIIVGGAQIFADVDAPEALAALAAIERARSATNFFPLKLDAAGLIRTATGGAGSTATLDRALATGRALVDAMAIAAAERQDARLFMAQLANLGAGAVSRLPRDLFFPRPGRETTTREIVLPGGATGSIAVTASATTAPDSGLLETSERRIVTRLEGEERSTVEGWSLARI